MELNENVLSQSRTKYDEIIKKLNLSQTEINEILAEYNCSLNVQNEVTPWSIVCFLNALLLKIKTRLVASIDRQQSSTVQESRQIENGIQSALAYGLKPLAKAVNDNGNSGKLLCTVKILMELMSIRHLFAMHPQNEFKFILITLLEGIFSLVICKAGEKYHSIANEMLIKTCQLVPRTEYFKVVLYIKGNKEYSQAFHTVVNNHLLYFLKQRGGFVGLCTVLLPTVDGSKATDDKLPPSWQGCEVISKIVAQRNHRRAFHRAIAEQICGFLREDSVCSDDVNPFLVIAAVFCLNRLYQLPLRDLHQMVKRLVLGGFDLIAQPTDLLRGIILYDEKELRCMVKMVHAAFCTSGPSEVTLPSSLLSNYLPLFVQLYSQLHQINDVSVKRWLAALVVRCLSNRDSAEQIQLVETILFQTYVPSTKTMHSRVAIENVVVDDTKSMFSLKIIPEPVLDLNDEDYNDPVNKFTTSYDPSSTLVHILKESNHNILIYDIFLHLLRLFSSCITQSSTPLAETIEFIEDFKDLTMVIELRFKRNYMIINTLNELIAHKPFHHQFQENPQKMVELFEQILRDYTSQPLNGGAIEVSNNSDELLLIILSIIQEFLHKITNHEQETIKRLYGTLNDFNTAVKQRHTSSSSLIRKKLDLIMIPSTNKEVTNSRFVVARTLIIDSTEPHLKVYGLCEMLKLITTKDVEATTNAHTVLAIAVKLLKDSESYVFLNCIKLLIALTDVVEATVLDTLVAEYQQEIADNSIEDADYRLKIGETIIKVTEGLGKLYRIVSCFLVFENHSTNAFIHYLRSSVVQLQRHFDQLLFAWRSPRKQRVPHFEPRQFGYYSSGARLSGASILPRGIF